MRFMSLLVCAAACGAPLEDEGLPVEVRGGSLQSLRVQLGGASCRGDCQLVAPPQSERVPLAIEGVTGDGRAFTLDRDLWLPPESELLSIVVADARVELQLIDVGRPRDLALAGLTVENFSSRPVIAYAGCDLQEVQPGATLRLGCLSQDFVAVQQTAELGPGVTSTTTYALWPD